MALSLHTMRERQNSVRRNWGFQFSLWCSILWGTCYLGIGIVLHGDSFLGTPHAQRDPVLSAFVLAMLLSVLVCIMSVLWVAAMGRMREYVHLLRSFRAENRLMAACAVCGGIAELSNYYVASMMDTSFSVGMVMFYPIVGALIARLWFKEAIPRLCLAGLLLVLGGCVFLYVPQMAQFALEDGVVFTGLVAGIAVGVAWGIEGACSSRVQDTVDATVCVATRYTYEVILWLFVFVGVTLTRPDVPLLQSIGNLVASPDMAMMVIVAACLTFNYFAWYESFALCGVCCGLAVSDISGYVVVLLGMVLMANVPDWPTVIACLFMMVGVFVIYTSGVGHASVLREVDTSPATSLLDHTYSVYTLPLKASLIVTLSRRGPSWDFELAELICGKGGQRKTRLRNQARTALIEAQAAGMITVVDERVDDGTAFAEGKLLSCYTLTQFGYERLLDNKLARKGERDVARSIL